MPKASLRSLPKNTASSARRIRPLKPKRKSPRLPPEIEPHWTFLTNHSHVLILLNHDSSMVLRTVATHVGITERAVQRIIADLVAGGYLEREKVGRKNQYRIHLGRRLRHPIEKHRSVGDLLSLTCKIG